MLKKMIARYKSYSLNSSITSRKLLCNDHVLFLFVTFFHDFKCSQSSQTIHTNCCFIFFKMSSRQMLQVISCCQNGNVFLICSFHRTLHYYEKISNISTITMNVLQYLEGWDIGATAADINPPLRLG